MDIGLTEEMKVVFMVGLFDNTCPLTSSQAMYDNLGPGTMLDFVVAPW